MLKLRILLLSNYFYLILFFLTLFYSFTIIHYGFKTKYSSDDTVISGYLDEIKINDLSLKIVVIGKEKVLGNYYFKDQKEKETFFQTFKLGDDIEVEGTLKRPNNNTVPNLFNYQTYLLSKKIYYLIDITNISFKGSNNNPFYALKNYIINHINKINLSHGYVRAFLLGDITDIDNKVKTSYQLNGISHLFAISGAQISLLGLALLKILKKIRVGEKRRYSITVFVLFIYMFLTNFSPSVLRATLFFILLALNKIYYLNIKTANLLVITLIITLLTNPFIIYNVGFLYSFIISFFLILFSTSINQHKSYLMKLIMVSYIAFLASLPISLSSFYQINYLSLIYNLFFVPFVSFILYPISLVTFFFPFLDKLLYLLIYIMEKTSLFLANIDSFLLFKKPSILVVMLYYLIITLALWKKKIIPFLFLLFFHYHYHFFIRSDYLLLIDVGQGDSILLISNNQVCLIDTGGKKAFSNEEEISHPISNNITLPLLKSLGYRKIDYLFLTHGDEDHSGEAINIINNFSVDHVIFNGNSYNYLEKEIMATLKQKKVIYFQDKVNNIYSVGHFQLFSLNNLKTNENDSSLVLLGVINGYRFLLMGDASKNSEQHILSEYNIKDVDIIKLGHHGSKTSSSDELLSLKPKYALISVGLNNHFNHPAKEVIEALGKYQIEYYQTSTEGSVLIKFKNELLIKTYPP